MGFLSPLKLHINQIIRAEIGSDYLVSIYQTYAVVKYFILFPITFMKCSRSSVFIASPK